MNERKPFNVLCKVSSVNGLNNVSTFHYAKDRTVRHNKIANVIGEGNCIAYFIVDKAHPNGNEVHCVYDNGIVVIYNENSKRLITELIARPNQIYRYWSGLGIAFPSQYNHIIRKARKHQMLGYNEW